MYTQMSELLYTTNDVIATIIKHNKLILTLYIDTMAVHVNNNNCHKPHDY